MMLKSQKRKLGGNRMEEKSNSKEPMEPVQTVEQVFPPLDEKLQLQPGSLTPLQLSYLVHFASFASFKQAAKMLMQHHGVAVSASTSRRQTEEIGALAEEVQNEQATSPLLQSSSNQVEGAQSEKTTNMVISSDGAYISLRGK